jgi:hypothetical protein
MSLLNLLAHAFRQSHKINDPIFVSSRWEACFKSARASSSFPAASK